jgi:hypothetical protein
VNVGDLVLVCDCPGTSREVLGIITGIDYNANDFGGDLDADLYRVFIAEQNVIRWFTNRNLVLLSNNREGKNDYLC